MENGQSATDVLPFSIFHFPFSPFHSWIQKLHPPPVALAYEQLALVQAIRPAAPKLDRARLQSESRPVRRPRNVLAVELALELGDPRVEVRRALHGTTLPRCPRADLAPPRARREVRVGFLVAHGSDASLDPNLALQRRPVKIHRGAAIGRELPPLAALEIRVKDEAALLDGFEQQYPDGRLTVFRGRRQRKGGRIGHLLAWQRLGFSEPLLKQNDRIVEGLDFRHYVRGQMLLERYYDDTLAQASYLIACEKTGDAIVIDPNRDVQTYIRAAASQRVRIRYVTETHIHADFLSGSRELARATGARLLLSDHGGDDWSYAYRAFDGAQLIRDGEKITVGKVRLDVVHTPGHTPEHICFLITDTAVGDRAMGLISGDFLFVGDVGRPDLLERAANVAGSMDRASRQLYASLQRLARLPDYLQVWPGHGAGSACGKALGAVPQTTMGYERLYNPALQLETEDDFVRWVLEDQPEPPRYFAEMKRQNRDGPPPWPERDIERLDARAIDAALAKGTWVVDVRGSADFAHGHIPGTINIPSSKSLATYAGTVLSYDRPIAILAKTREHALTVLRQLAMIGFDQIVGVATLEVLQQLKSDGRPMASVRLIEPRTLADKLETNGTRVIDVRGRSEWNHGHLPKATHMHLGEIEERTKTMKRDEPIVVHCQSGTRSSIAASLLMARGFTNVANLAGGFDAWRKAGLPVAEKHS
jgi:hydroxyacylglutathione hydrolase